MAGVESFVGKYRRTRSSLRLSPSSRQEYRCRL